MTALTPESVPDISSLPVETTAPATAPSRRMPSFLRNKNNLIGLGILVPIVFVAFAAPWLPIKDPLSTDPINSLAGPSLSNPFGTDRLGRDIFSRTVAGLRVSVIVGFAAASLAMTGGVLFGALAGMLGRAADTVISAVVDVIMAFPALLLAIAIIAVFGAGMPQLIIALGVSSMPAAVRLQRSMAIGLKSRMFMDGARMANARTWWLMVRHVIPNTFAPMVVVATIYAANAILAEAALSFLGLGITPPTPSLGNLVADGRNFLREAWWISTLPGLAIVVLAMSLHLLSDGIREQLDPSLRK